MYAMPRSKAHVVELSTAERDELARVVSTGRHPAQMIRRARVLLELDVSQGPVADRAVVADRVGMSGESIRLIAKRFVDTGGDVEATISRKKRVTPPVPSGITGDGGGRPVAPAWSAPPARRPPRAMGVAG